MHHGVTWTISSAWALRQERCVLLTVAKELLYGARLGDQEDSREGAPSGQGRFAFEVWPLYMYSVYCTTVYIQHIPQYIFYIFWEYIYTRSDLWGALRLLCGTQVYLGHYHCHFA